MMKTLISSVFTFLLIYIQGLEISRLRQVFFKNIKMRPKYNMARNHGQSVVLIVGAETVPTRARDIRATSNLL
jgi:hypothetical protein